MIVGLMFLALIGVYCLVCAGIKESVDITNAAPPAPPTTDAYEDSSYYNV